MIINNPAAGGAPFDPAVIARLANDLFAALPGNSGPIAGSGVAAAAPATPPVEVGALPVASAVPPSSAVGNLSGTELRSAPATLSGATLRSPQAGLAPSAALGPYDFRPQLIPVTDALTVPESHGIAPTVPATPPVEMGVLSAAPVATSTSTSASPTEAELRALPETLVEDSVQPSLAGAVPAAGGMPGSSYYFLDAAQAPLPPVVLTPQASQVPQGDYDFHPGMLPDLGFVAGPYDPRLDRRDFPV